MAEEQKIVFELVDRAGNSAGTASAPSPQAGSTVPGSQVAQDFQQWVGSEGADSRVGRGSAPAAAYTTSQTPSVTSSGDPLLTAARQIFAADPRTTAEELQHALGLEASRAQNLVNEVLGRVSTPAHTTDNVSQTQQPRVNWTIPATTPQQASETAQRESETSIKAPPMEPIEAYTPFNSSFDPFHLENKLVGAGDLEAAGRMIQSSKAANAQSNEPTPASSPDLSGVNVLLHTSSALANQMGSAGRVVSTALNAVGAVINTPAGAAALEAVLPGLAAAGPYAVAGAALASIPLAVVGASFNEAERVRSTVGNYAPEAAQANAEAQVRQLMANLRTAENLGYAAGEYTTASSRLSAATQGVRDTLSEPLINELNSGLRLLASAMESLQQSLTQELIGNIAGKLGLNPLGKLEAIAVSLKIIEAEATRKQRESIKTPFGWFQGQPHLTPPPPFSGMVQQGIPVGAKFNPVPGLSF